LKVLILTLEYTSALSGGAGTHVFDLGAGLSRAGHQATIIAYTAGSAAVTREGDATIHLVPPSDQNRANAAQRSMVEGLLAFNDDLIAYGKDLISREIEKPDIIHFHNWYTYPAARYLSNAFGIPAIGTIHFISEPIEKWWGQTPDPEIVEQEKKLFGEVDSLITVSHSMRRLISSTHALAEDRIHVVHNGLDALSFIKSPLAPEPLKRLRQTIAAAGECILMYAGRLNPMKGISALLTSAARVIAENPRAVYLLVGEPDSRAFGQSMRELFKRHPELNKRVKLMGKLPREQVALLYQAADVALIPSVYDPFPYAALEAMSAGVPVIASNAGGLAEVIEHGRTGLLVPVNTNESAQREIDIPELTAAQLALLSDADYRTSLGRAAQQRIMNEFNVDRMIQSLVRVYLQKIGVPVGSA
jgi:glycosyltransferase involved in cell wall biosynthesis